MHKVLVDQRLTLLRFFFGRMKEIGYKQEELVAKLKADFGDSL